MPYLRRASCRIPTAPDDRRARAAKHGKRDYRYCTEFAPLFVCGRARGKLERCTFSVGSPCCLGKQGFGGKATETLCFLTEQVIPTLKQQYPLPENVKIILGGYSLAGLFALWASTQTDLFYGVAAASPSVWFPDWMEFEQRHPMQVQHIYLSLGDKEEHTKNIVMAAVGDNIRTLHSRLAARGTDCTLEWNSGGHFKDADLRTAKAFQWVMEEHT